MLSIDWKPNKASPVPLHRQIAEWIREKISNGKWPLGFRLPPQRLLAQALGVNRSTVVAAYDEITAEGLIEGRGGSGTKVVHNTWNLLAAAPPPDWNAYMSSGVHEPNLPTIRQINQAEFVPNVIRLGTGELSPSLIPADAMRQVILRLAEGDLAYGYEEPKGWPGLRERISRYLQTIGIQASPSSILIVSGALQALQLISIGLLHKGSTILTEKPSYLQSLHVFQSAGMRLAGVEMDREGLRADRIPMYRKQHQAALLYTIPSFHNPTGTLMSADRRRQLLSICQQERLPIIEDDVYRELWLDEEPPKPLKALDNNGLVLYIGSLSKSLSPGLRIGWIAGPEPVIDRLADLKMQTDYGSSSLSQRAAAEWFAGGGYARHLENVRRELRIRRNAALELLSRYFADIASWEKPSGGFYIWVRLLSVVSIKKVFDAALAEGILLNPGNVYDVHSDRYLRISYSYASLFELEDGLSRLSRIIRRLS